MGSAELNNAKRAGHAQRMDEVYRHQRHFYDLTRKWYLLGRDRVIDDLIELPAGTSVLEAGCGTARNLLRAAKINPGLRCFGIDASARMLETARRRVVRSGHVNRIALREADIVDFNPQTAFGSSNFDQIVCSYTLSMVPEWRAALTHLLDVLAPGGRIQVVDFGMQQAHMPAARAILRAWLRWFHVKPCPELPDEFDRQCALNGLTRIEVNHLHGGYAVLMSAYRR